MRPVARPAAPVAGHVPHALAALATLPALTAALAGCAPSPNSESARQLYASQCASCHADDGRGVPARRGLEPRLDLTRSTLVAGREKGLIYPRIAFGYLTMPGFAHKLSQDELELLAEHVLIFAPTDAAP